MSEYPGKYHNCNFCGNYTGNGHKQDCPLYEKPYHERTEIPAGKKKK